MPNEYFTYAGHHLVKSRRIVARQHNDRVYRKHRQQRAPLSANYTLRIAGNGSLAARARGRAARALSAPMIPLSRFGPRSD